MTAFDYSDFRVRDAITQAHRSSWDAIGRPGSQWTGRERVEIARQARAARALRGAPPWKRSGWPDAAEILPSPAVEAARKIAADAHQIDAEWAARKISELGDAAYVELGSVVVTVTAIDAFAEALGCGYEPLPEPEDGEPDGESAPDSVDGGAYVPWLEPWQGPNVSRALSLVPSANALFMQNVMTMYSSGGESFYDLVWGGPLSRPQAELLAARVSAVNECFY